PELIVALLAVPPAETARTPLPITVADTSNPKTVSLPRSVVWLSVPPLAMVRNPPALTIVASARPPERTNIAPPRLTVSPVEVTPDEMKNGEFAEVMTLPIGAVHIELASNFNSMDAHMEQARAAKAARCEGLSKMEKKIMRPARPHSRRTRTSQRQSYL